MIIATYVWQAVMAVLVAGCIALAVIGFIANDWHGYLYLVYAVTFAIHFVTGAIIRSTERITRRIR